MIDDHSEGLLTEEQAHCGTEKGFTKGGRSWVTIDMLPDVALLKIFDFYLNGAQIEAWYTLVHVCRKWRYIVFGSPCRLNLRLYCKARTPVREMLHVWPLLPIVVGSNGHKKWGVDNVVAALEHNDRVRELGLRRLPRSQLEKVLAVAQQPFPALTWLQLWSEDESAPIDSDSFLGGSAPSLRFLLLYGIPFPGLPNLLLSAAHLVHLELWRIPDSGYISPDAMATGLSVLTRLESLTIGFKSPRSRPDQNSRRPPPLTRTPLPVLTKLRFKGVSEYLEDLVARIDAPLLEDVYIIFFYQLVFDTPELAQFISRTPKFKVHDEARVVLSDRDVLFTLPQTFDGAFKLRISCRQSDWQLSSLAQVCSSSFPHTLIPAVERLYILEDGVLDWQDDRPAIESSQWLEVLHPFAAVKGLYISREFAARISPTLKELVGERVTEVLPALQSLFLEEPLPSGPVQDAINQFVAARQLSNQPNAGPRWEGKRLDD